MFGPLLPEVSCRRLNGTEALSTLLTEYTSIMPLIHVLLGHSSHSLVTLQLDLNGQIYVLTSNQR